MLNHQEKKDQAFIQKQGLPKVKIVKTILKYIGVKADNHFAKNIIFAI